jgi:uncharacterized protein (TIGR02145 family)
MKFLLPLLCKFIRENQYKNFVSSFPVKALFVVSLILICCFTSAHTNYLKSFQEANSFISFKCCETIAGGFYSDLQSFNDLYKNTSYRSVSQTIEELERPAAKVLLNILPEPPVVEDICICYPERSCVLHAIGENIKWYTSADLSGDLEEGNEFTTPDFSGPGIYRFYVTQTISGLESLPDTVSVTVEMPPDRPLADDLTLCEGSFSELTAAGENIKWYVQNTDSLFDERDGLVYKTVGIGKQTWMAENLNFTSLGNSFYYNNDSATYASTYGRLYSFVSARVTCPTDWLLPKDRDWIELEYFLGMDTSVLYEVGWRGNVEGGALKEKDTTHWSPPNSMATDEYGFTALPAGYHHDVYEGGYYPSQLGNYAVFWVGGHDGPPDFSSPMIRKLIFEKGNIYRNYSPWYTTEHGATDQCSIRCIKEIVTPSAYGNTYLPDVHAPGTYTFYATQSPGSCESQATDVKLTIKKNPDPPSVTDTSLCEPYESPDLFVEGENIRWYSNSDLSVPINNGNSYNTGQTVVGVYTYYITQTINDCESVPDSLSLKINPLPEVDLGKDTTINQNEILTLGFNDLSSKYLWSNGSEESTIDIEGYLMEPGDYIYWVSVTDTLKCNNSDTIQVTLNPAISTPSINFEVEPNIFPNPSGSVLFIDFPEIGYEQVEIKILNQLGVLTLTQKFSLKHAHQDPFFIDISSLPEGWYIIKITSKNATFSSMLNILR